jgi:hypothetical protein
MCEDERVESGEGEGGVSWGPNTMFCAESGNGRDVVALLLCTHPA